MNLLLSINPNNVPAKVINDDDEPNPSFWIYLTGYCINPTNIPVIYGGHDLYWNIFPLLLYKSNDFSSFSDGINNSIN